MADPRHAPGAGDDGLVDPASGLVWEPRPGERPTPWGEAEDPDWRLPSIDELMGVLVGLPPAHPCTPPPGRILWSASESPFAARSQVRVVACADGPTYRIVLRDRLSLAWAWRIRREFRRPR